MLECSVPFRSARLRERGVDVAEDVGDVPAKVAKDRDGSKGKEANEQRVLHEVLTFLAVNQVLKLHKKH